MSTEIEKHSISAEIAEDVSIILSASPGLNAKIAHGISHQDPFAINMIFSISDLNGSSQEDVKSVIRDRLLSRLKEPHLRAYEIHVAFDFSNQ